LVEVSVVSNVKASNVPM